MKAKPHPRQEQRLAALRRFEILDTPREPDFDDITRLIAGICEAPVSIINFIDADRQWFKSEIGLGVRETPLETSICSHAILENDFVEISDTLSDRRMGDNPLCTGSRGFRFYAGALLKTPDGLPLGTLCVLDYSARSLTSLQRSAVQVLAKQVMKQLELRRALNVQHTLRREIDHRVTNSLAMVSALIRVQQAQMKEPSFDRAMQALESRVTTIALLHRELCHTETAEVVGLQPFMQRIESLLKKTAPPGINVDFQFDDAPVSSREASSIAMLVNEFASNSFKHAFPGRSAGHVVVRGVVENDGRYAITYRDDGTGRNPKPVQTKDAGLGTMIIQASVEQLGAVHSVESTGSGYRLNLTFLLERS
jgi:two-component sensor histidine kinase